MEKIMKREVINVKLPKRKHRADFLFHNGMFRPQVIASAKIYNRKKLPKIDIKGE